MAKLKPVPVASAPEAPVVKKKSKMLLIAAIGVLVVGAGSAGGAWFWARQHSATAEPKVAEKKAPVFVTLDSFTVNLLQEAGDHYLQIGLVYQVDGDKTADAMKTYMPIIRNRILMVLSGKHPADISKVEGKQKLVAELVQVARDSLPDGASPERGISGAFLSSFVIQ